MKTNNDSCFKPLSVAALLIACLLIGYASAPGHDPGVENNPCDRFCRLSNTVGQFVIVDCQGCCDAQNRPKISCYSTCDNEGEPAGMCDQWRKDNQPPQPPPKPQPPKKGKPGKPGKKKSG